MRFMLKCCSCSYICCSAYCRYQRRGSSLQLSLQLEQLSSEIYRNAAIALAYITSSQDLQWCSCASICSVSRSIADLKHRSVPRSIADLMCCGAWCLSYRVKAPAVPTAGIQFLPQASSAATPPHLLQRLQSAQFRGLSQTSSGAPATASVHVLAVLKCYYCFSICCSACRVKLQLSLQLEQLIPRSIADLLQSLLQTCYRACHLSMLLLLSAFAAVLSGATGVKLQLSLPLEKLMSRSIADLSYCYCWPPLLLQLQHLFKCLPSSSVTTVATAAASTAVSADSAKSRQCFLCQSSTS